MSDLELRVTIRLGNDAMQTGEDLSDALRVIASDVKYLGTLSRGTHAVTVLDVNGNRVGQWKIREGEQDD